MDLDDFPIGRVLTRRAALALLGSTGTLVLLGASHSSAGSSLIGKPHYPCVVRPASTQGPYYVDEKLHRSAPLEGAIVDLWQCDAEGVYSDAVDRNFDTTGKKFLRGYQITDKHGAAKFTTIYPGWYPGRTVHIHYKIRSPESAQSPYEFTGQMYFHEGTSDRVYAKPPYASRGKHSVSNITDRIYNNDGGRQSMLVVREAGDGYTASLTLHSTCHPERTV
jgi:hypothetical protein